MQLRANGTPEGRKIGSLIELKELSRRVLQSQNEGWPHAGREEERRKLRLAHDRFLAAYGPINKTTFTQAKDGNVIRRMPNLAKFREDPDAMLVMALEEYDEITGAAHKAAIMHRDVVGPKPPVTRVASAEEGLLASLDHRGAVDVPYIAKLYGKPESQVVAELGDLIFQNHDTGNFETADQYLSGNVREKLRTAEKAGPEYARNAEALRRVQPEDVLPGDIDANLGAPWIPEADIQAFAEEVFGGAVSIGHLKKDALWSVDPDYRALQSVAATGDYGTARINGTSLLEQALNLKTPVIYDTIHNGEREERVVNQEATLAAKEKQRALKERFRSWVFTDPDRTERLVGIYNDTYNNLRPRLFDGSHLQFPGMNTAITLKPHQVDAVWRCMSGGNTLLAHCVGAGKSFEIGAAAMKRKQAGLSKKSVIAVPNHLLEQFAREFQQLYPNARLLIAGKDDFSRECRKTLTAKIATGDWDAIITTHSSFERIGMSRDYQQGFLLEQIEEYEQLLLDARRPDAGRGRRNLIKQIEKQKASRVERLKDLLAQDKKDDGLVFDDLGIDQIFIDEFQQFKNLEAPSKMERVAGIPTGGSERAFDLFMKARYLDERHPGHGLVGASGTPISNSMVEAYTLQRYFDLQSLKDRGIEHLDAWAGTFGEVVDAMEISPDGQSLKPRSRFSRFINLPELSRMFTSFADVQTADMLKLPRPRLKGGKPQVISCPMSEEQRALQAELVKRYERIRNERVDPREDNALAITTDGRKLALDARMLSASARDYPGSKINVLVAETVKTWKQTAPKRSTQMIFCDMGVHPKPFSVYAEIVEKLVDHGIPRAEIAVIGDADTDAKKHVLFEKVRQGVVRILLGSTQKMGTGTNVQKRLIRKHDLDVPWKPAEIEQRDGRIERQGNDNDEVEITRYVTEGTFDAFMWQANETKARYINQFMRGDLSVRRMEDIGAQELSYAEVKAIASGNPAVLTLAEADAELHRLAILKKNHQDEQFLARRAKQNLPDAIARLEGRLAGLTADHAAATAHERDPLVIGGRSCRPDDALAALGHRLDALPDRVRQTESFPIGRYCGLAFGLILHVGGAGEIFLEGAATRRGLLSRDHRGPRAVLNALDRLAEGYPGECGATRRELTVARDQLRDHTARLGRPFIHDAYTAELTDLRDRLKAGLSQATPEPGTEQVPITELADRITSLKAAHTIEAAPERTTPRRIAAEEPVTARIRRQNGSEPAAAPAPETTPAVGGPIPAINHEPDSIDPLPPSEPPASARPPPGFRQHAAQVRRNDSQLSFF